RKMGRAPAADARTRAGGGTAVRVAFVRQLSHRQRIAGGGNVRTRSLPSDEPADSRGWPHGKLGGKSAAVDHGSSNDETWQSDAEHATQRTRAGSGSRIFVVTQIEKHPWTQWDTSTARQAPQSKTGGRQHSPRPFTIGSSLSITSASA